MTEQNNNRDVVRMESDLNNIKELLLEVRDDIKNLNQTYIPRNETNVMFQQRDLAIQDLKQENTELKKEMVELKKEQKQEITAIKTDMKDARRTAPAWISSIMAIVAFLYAFFGK